MVLKVGDIVYCPNKDYPTFREYLENNFDPFMIEGVINDDVLVRGRGFVNRPAKYSCIYFKVIPEDDLWF